MVLLDRLADLPVCIAFDVEKISVRADLDYLPDLFFERHLPERFFRPLVALRCKLNGTRFGILLFLGEGRKYKQQNDDDGPKPGNQHGAKITERRSMKMERRVPPPGGCHAWFGKNVSCRQFAGWVKRHSALSWGLGLKDFELFGSVRRGL